MIKPQRRTHALLWPLLLPALLALVVWAALDRPPKSHPTQAEPPKASETGPTDGEPAP